MAAKLPRGVRGDDVMQIWHGVEPGATEAFDRIAGAVGLATALSFRETIRENRERERREADRFSSPGNWSLH